VHRNTVTIDNEHTRRVVTCALWHIVSEQVIGESELRESCFSLGWRSVHPAYRLDDGIAEAEYRLARRAIIRSAARRVGTAKLGETIALPVSVTELEEALADCVRTLDQNGELLESLGRDAGHDVLACRGVAVRLLEAIRSAPSQVAPRLDLESLLGLDDAPGVPVPDFRGEIRAERRAQRREGRRGAPVPWPPAGEGERSPAGERESRPVGDPHGVTSPA
jgi:hypothetical protein